MLQGHNHKEGLVDQNRLSCNKIPYNLAPEGRPEGTKRVAHGRCESTLNSSSHLHLLLSHRAGEHPGFPEGGKMSQYLEKIPLGTAIGVRGPTGHVVYQGFGRVSIAGSLRTYKYALLLCWCLPGTADLPTVSRLELSRAA